MPRVKFEDGITINFDKQPSQQDIDEAYNFAKSQKPAQPSEPKESLGRSLYREGLAPWVHGSSSLALGVPKAVAKQTGTEELIYPEQKTFPGKVNRFAAETVGLLGGGALKAGTKVASSVGKLLEKLVVPKIAKKIASGAITGGVAGVLQTPEEGQGILKPKERLEQGLGWGLAGGALPAAGAGLGLAGKGIKGIARNVAGIDKELLAEVEKRGVRNVLQKKYYDAKIPEIIQERITTNIDKLEEAAGNTYSELTTPLRKSKFDMAKLRGEVIKIANKVKTNPFDTEKSQIDNKILDGIVNKMKGNNLGEALDARRALDDIIYSGTGELKTSFGKEVRDILNKELHKNKGLEAVDKQWRSLQEALKEGRKATGETGEKFLARFASLTKKQKEMLSTLEKKIGGEPFIDDLTNWSLAQKFINKTKPLSMGDVYSLGLTRATKPALRGLLRQGENIEQLGQKFKGLLKI